MRGPVVRQTQRRVRRRKIIDGAISVIAESGLEAVSHRRVAAAAAVPLASTTYYFESLDELRAAALRELVHRDLTAMEVRLELVPRDGELGDALGDLIHQWLRNREMSIVTLETFASAMRRESIKEIAKAWDDAWIAALEPRIGRTRALAAVAAAFGYIQYAMLQPKLPPRKEVIAVMRELLRET